MADGAEILMVNVTFNQMFRRKETTPSKSADFDVILILLPQASDKVQLSLIAFQRYR